MSRVGELPMSHVHRAGLATTLASPSHGGSAVLKHCPIVDVEKRNPLFDGASLFKRFDTTSELVPKGKSCESDDDMVVVQARGGIDFSTEPSQMGEKRKSRPSRGCCGGSGARNASSGMSVVVSCSSYEKDSLDSDSHSSSIHSHGYGTERGDRTLHRDVTVKSTKGRRSGCGVAEDENEFGVKKRSTAHAATARRSRRGCGSPGGDTAFEYQTTRKLPNNKY